MSTERATILQNVAEARAAGARLKGCCQVLGLDCRTIQRWQQQPEDQRKGPISPPGNKLSELERAGLLKVLTSKEYRDLPPSQIVPLLADKGQYIASESTMYRLLRAERLQRHRGRAKPAAPRRRPRGLTATGANQVYSWDITYLRSDVRGFFFYLYLVIDVWSRKVVGYRIEPEERSELSAELLREICEREGVERGQVVLHSDNGAPMKGASMLATLQELGVAASFSRPSVSNDNPYSESIFRTMKYRPNYPSKPFASINAARAWVKGFVFWYNMAHLHSAIGWVTPSDRHTGKSTKKLKLRRGVYRAAHQRHPERWASNIRPWHQPSVVHLNQPLVEEQAA